MERQNSSTSVRSVYTFSYFVTGSNNKRVIFYAEVPINDVTNFRMPLSSVILAKGSDNSWDDDFIYRTTFTIEAGQSAYKYHVWYSARSKTGAWHIGYTEGELGTKFNPLSIRSNSP